ncbi:MAG: hypothetical protein IJC27_02160 [Lentisphaeria bacterium]|nr:hypothetical protein [Lentisphaeria bacterium]
MADKFYYIKSNRRTTGPFPLKQLEKMYRNGLISAADMVSENKISWQSAEKFFAEPEAAESEEKKPSAVKTLSLNIARVFFPEFKVPAEEKQTAKTPPPEKSQKQKIVPEPVCSVISLVWNAPAAMKNLQLVREYKRKSGKEDDTSLYAGISAGLLIFLLLMLLLAVTVLYLPSKLNAVLLATLLAAGVFMVFLLENLCLSAVCNVKKLLDCDLLIMQILLTSVAAFGFALPLAGAVSAGVENIPAALKVLIIFFSCAFALGEMVNMVWGFVEVNRRVFKMSSGVLASVAVMQVFQLIVIGIISWKLFKFI